MEYTYADYQKMVKTIRKITDFTPEIGVVLGSGLGDFVKRVDVKATIPYGKIPGMPVSTNVNHKGQFIFGNYEKKIPVILMQGRLHLYEGYSAREVVAPIRVMGLLGAKKIVLTNAAGGVNTSFHPGDLMMIDDQIGCLVESPLRGANIDELGPRFPDMSDIYDIQETDLIVKKARKKKLPIQRGTYMQFYGPQYESKAEIRMARTCGADSCGMSTTGEAIAANHMGLKVVGVSFISNMACGITKEKLSDEEVIAVAEKSEKDIDALMKIILETLHDGH